MKKSIIILLVLGLLFISVGCEKQKGSNSSIVAEKPHHNSTTYKLNYNHDWLENDLTELGLKDLTIGERVRGCFTAQRPTSSRYVYLFNDYQKYGENRIYHDSSLVIETDSKILLRDLANDNYSGSYGEEIYVCDVDDDGIDEVVLQQTVGMTGGAGQYLSRIFKVVDDEIIQLFNSSSICLYNTGFSCVLKDDYKMEVQNIFTGYSITLDMIGTKKYSGIYFDEAGKVISNVHFENIVCDSFMEFIPKDVDNDGTFEVACLQYVSLYGHSDGIGYAKSILKFNKNTKMFEVVGSEFIPMGAET
jgi:hypothetical protein